MTTQSWATDERGPRLVAVVQLPAGCAGFIAVDDVSLGDAIGGVRMAQTVTPAEVVRLARAMTLKNAAAGLPHGGGKAGIRIPEGFDPASREPVIRAFAQAIRGLTEYIPGPDMGTDETAMAWVHDEIGRAVGLPALLGGIPLDEIGATGFGVAVCVEALQSAGRLTLSGARVAIQGFGAVGRHAAQSLSQRGACVVAVSDTSGAVYDPDGLDVADLLRFKADRRLADYPDGKILDRDSLLTIPCDILVPAAVPDVIHEGNADQIQATVIVSGANIAITEAAEAMLGARGVLCVPDFIANAGGVICAAVEWRRGGRAEAFSTIEERIRSNTLEMLERATATGVPPRRVAEAMARARLDRAAAYRRRF